MTRRSIIPFAAAIILTTAAIPADAGGYVGLEVSNHGVSLGFGASNWGIWGSSWNSGVGTIGFSATLTGYGDWVQVDGLGRVWRPWVAAGWQPYTHGRWMWTSMGWTWVAYEPWGWVPHHYGNWAYSTIGWVWTPGYAYHPGNVVWVSTGVHVGWYPCAPRGWSHSHRGYNRGWNSGYGSGHHNGYSQGYADGWRDARYATWVPRSQVAAENIAHHSVGHETATRGVARSGVTVMNNAPTRTQVEGYVGRSVPEARITERHGNIDGRDVRMVRPEGLKETVRRHGESTVERALNPEARRRVSGGETAMVQRQNNAVAKTTERSRPTSERSGTHRSMDTQRRGDAPRSSTRLERTATSSSATVATRTPSGSVPSPQRRTASVSADSHRSTGRARSSPVTARQTEKPQMTTTRSRSVTHAAPPQQPEPTARRRGSAGNEPEATTPSDLERRMGREKIETAKEEKSKRRRSRN